MLKKVRKITIDKREVRSHKTREEIKLNKREEERIKGINTVKCSYGMLK